MGGFNWDGETYTPGESTEGKFIDSEAFNRLIYNDAVLFITGIRDGVSQYKNEEPRAQWLVDFIAPDGEEYTKGVTKGNPERDARMIRFRNTLEATGEPFESTPLKVPSKGGGQPRIEFGPPKATATK